VRRSLPLLAAAFALAACRAGAPAPATSSPATPSPVPLPSGVPATFSGNLEAGDIPIRALIPRDDDPTGSWYASTRGAEFILVAYADGRRRGLVGWRWFPDAPHWRAVFATEPSPAARVLSIQVVSTTDLTGNGTPDALVLEATGGSGACGRWSVVDLATARTIYDRALCDGGLAPHTAPSGLALTEAVYRPGDAHCCPSATRTSVLTYAGAGRWNVASTTVSPTHG